MKIMIHELKETEFDIARPLFSDLEEYQLWLRAVFERNKPGRIFVNEKKNPSSGFCYLGKVFFIFAGSSKDAKFNHGLKEIFDNDIFPNYKAVYKYYYTQSTKLNAFIGKDLRGCCLGCALWVLLGRFPH